MSLQNSHFVEVTEDPAYIQKYNTPLVLSPDSTYESDAFLIKLLLIFQCLLWLLNLAAIYLAGKGPKNALERYFQI